MISWNCLPFRPHADTLPHLFTLLKPTECWVLIESAVSATFLAAMVISGVAPLGSTSSGYILSDRFYHLSSSIHVKSAKHVLWSTIL
jgi:hypothetical protein